MNRRRQGFTLIELLTVIAILVLLIGMLIPSLSSSRQQAKANVCLSKLKGIGTAFVVYLNENRDTFPPARLKKATPTATEDYVNEYNRKHPRWQWFIETDSGPVIDPKLFRRLNRPFDDAGLGMINDRSGITMTIDVFTCPALDDPEYAMDERNGAYGYNYQYLGNSRQDTDRKLWDNFAVNLHRIRSPGQTVLLADSRGGGPKHGVHSYTLDPPRLAVEQSAKRFGPGPQDLAAGIDPVLYSFSPVEMRHRNHGNVMFVDSHVEAMTWAELGYELQNENYPNIPVPIIDPAGSTGGHWNNRLWTGTGVDEMAPSRNAGTP
jgi:prepilin-type N-terminal cleavage/methylation domain-containing protein/prepilin-type processing-associated H-X9-DG protein